MAPELSLVIAVWKDTAGLDRCLEALLPQLDAGCELLVVTNLEPPARWRDDARLAWIRQPDERLIPELWSRGMEAAKGAHVAITTAHFEPAPDWVAAIRAAHARRGDAGISGPIEPPRGGSAKDWATYFLRYSSTFHLHGERALHDIPGDNASYEAAALRRHWGAIAHGFWEPNYHRLLVAEGRTLAWIPQMRVTQRASYPFGAFCRQRLLHGREFGSSRIRERGAALRLARIAASPLIPLVFLAKITARVVRSRRDFGPYALSLPVLAVFILVWALGETWGYISPLPAAPGDRATA